MKFNKRIMLTIALSVIVAFLLLGSSSLIARQGNQIVESGSAKIEYRDVRGIPFAFLKRSIGDRQCEIQRSQKNFCSTAVTDEPHKLMLTWMLLDMAFWFLVVFVLVYLVTKPKHKST